MRELIAGAVRDPQFGPTVMLGVGGVLAEAIGDVVFRPAPLDRATADEMIDDLRTQALLGPFRGEAAVDRDALASALVALGRVITERDDVASVDVNPLIIDADGAPVAVDALVELRRADHGDRTPSPPAAADSRAVRRPVRARGVSSSPGRRRTRASSGSCRCTTCWPPGMPGPSTAPTCTARVVLGVQTVADVAEIPDGAARPRLRVHAAGRQRAPCSRACAAKGIKAAFVTSAGYGEAGPAGKRAEDELVDLADELGILLAGPNGQGVVSTPASLCAQIVAPYPPPGRIAVASQSGNFVSSFLNLARATGVGISRAVSAGNAAAVSVADYLSYFADDPATSVGLAYLEGISDGRALFDQLADAARRKPLVLLKGGATAGGARAAASHTGALAADDKVFDGECRAAGDHPGGDRRGGVRGGGHVRHPASAARPTGGRGDDGRGLGRRHRRRDHRGIATSS